jgi:hypothetical protein
MSQQNYLQQLIQGMQASQQAWQPGPPGIVRPEPPAQVINEESPEEINKLLRNASTQRSLSIAAQPFYDPKLRASAPEFVSSTAQQNAEVNALLREAANKRSGGKRRRMRKSRKARKTRKVRKVRKSRRYHK